MLVLFQTRGTLTLIQGSGSLLSMYACTLNSSDICSPLDLYFNGYLFVVLLFGPAQAALVLTGSLLAGHLLPVEARRR